MSKGLFEILSHFKLNNEYFFNFLEQFIVKIDDFRKIETKLIKLL